MWAIRYLLWVQPLDCVLPCASFCHIRKIAGCACARNAGNAFPTTAGSRSRHASRHVRDARALLPVSLTRPYPTKYAHFYVAIGHIFESPWSHARDPFTPINCFIGIGNILLLLSKFQWKNPQRFRWNIIHSIIHIIAIHIIVVPLSLISPYRHHHYNYHFCHFRCYYSC